MMKGIKKLFLGLLFTTIVGVSFQSETKAATTTITPGEYNGGEIPFTVTFDDSDLATGDTVEVFIAMPDGDHAVKFEYDGSTWKDDASNPITAPIDVVILKNDIVTSVTAGATDNTNIPVAMSYKAIYKTGGTVEDSSRSFSSTTPVTVNAIHNPKVTVNTDYASLIDSTLVGGDGWYLDGESIDFKLVDKNASISTVENHHNNIKWIGSVGNAEGKDKTTASYKYAGSNVFNVEYTYDAVTAFELDQAFDKSINVGKESVARSINKVNSTYNTWTPDDVLALTDWKMTCAPSSADIIGGVSGNRAFKVRPSSAGTYTIKASAKGLTKPGETSTIDVATFTSAKADSIKIDLSPRPVRVALGGSVRIKVEAPADLDRTNLVIKQNYSHYDADWVDATREEILVTGLAATTDSAPDYIQVSAEDLLEPEGGPTSIKVPVYVEKAADISYRLDNPVPEIVVTVGDKAAINFDDIIYDYQGFAPTDDLQWIIPSAYSEIAQLVPADGKGKDVEVKGLKKGDAFVYLKVSKGENKVFPKSSDVKNYYVKIKVKEAYKGDPSYTLYDGAKMSVQVGSKEYIDFDLVVSDCINWNPDDCEYAWKIPSQYSDIAKIEQSDGFLIKGLKKGTAYAYIEIKTNAGKFPKSSSIDKKYLLPIYVGGDTPGPTGTPTPTPTGTPGTDLVVDNIDLTVGCTDSLATFVLDKVSTGNYTVNSKFDLVKVNNNGSALSKVTISAGAKTGRELGVEITDDQGNLDETSISVYPICKATKDSSNVTFTIPAKANTGNAQNHITSTGACIEAKFGSKVFGKSGSSWSGDASTAENISSTGSNSNVEEYSFTYKTDELLRGLGKSILKTGDGNTLTIAVCPVGTRYSDGTKNIKNTDVAASINFNVYKITLASDGNVTYKVDGTDVSDYFYAIEGVPYTIASVGKTGYTFDNWEGKESTSSSISDYKFTGNRTLKANYKSTSSSSSSSSSSKTTTAAGGSTTGNKASGGAGNDYDDVPRTGESKADIWILWSILLASILGAGYVIYRRFGLVNAIASVDTVGEVETPEVTETVETKAEEQNKEDNLQMLKDLRDFK